jgi:hypothetical protein
MVRCKFKVTSKTLREGGNTDINLFPVSSGSEENKTFWKYTPSGQFNFSCVNEEAVKQLEVGKEYYIDISEA